MSEFSTPAQEKLFKTTAEELRRIGYTNNLLVVGYRFPDYAAKSRAPERQVALAAFGREPLTYQTACFGVLLSYPNQKHGLPLIEDHRALGAPLQIEVRPDRVIVWIVGSSKRTTRPYGEYDDEASLTQMLRSGAWTPEEVLRAKNIGFTTPKERQLDFFDLGLIPALEDQIKHKLDPLLRESLAAVVEEHKSTTGNRPDERDIFRLAFRLLAGKVFHDSGIIGFSELDRASGPDEVLSKVAEYYRESPPRLLNYATREAAFKVIWSGLDFRHLSIDILVNIWTHTLVTEEIRQKYGIHVTPRTVAKYIVDRLPFEEFLAGNGGDRLVVEPCCGTAPFLIAAMQRIRDLSAGWTAAEQHALFKNTLVGFEQGTFGVEIGKLCLTLSDFPERNGFDIREQDIYTSTDFPKALARAGIVICNPPFQDLPLSHPHRARIGSVHQPVEILNRVLADIHPQGVLGFVMPRKLIDGQWYRDTRTTLAERFGQLELVSLPDVAFRESESEHETVLVLATEPKNNSLASRVRHRRVAKDDWERFSKQHQPTSDDVAVKTIEDVATSLAIPVLSEVWTQLVGCQTLDEIAEVHRGIEWNRPLVIDGEETGYRDELVLDETTSWTREGVPPRAEIFSFQKPVTKHLSMRPEDQRRGAYKLPWDRPKVILNANRRSRGPWRLSAFADFEKLTCYRTFLAVWPNDARLTTAIAAVLNSPVANGLAATREGPNIPHETIEKLPMPQFSNDQLEAIDNAVADYSSRVDASDWLSADAALRYIDAIVLQAYDLPPRVERKLLDHFRGRIRPVPLDFGDYFPDNFRPCFSLADYLSDSFKVSTAGAFRSRFQQPNEEILQAMDTAAEAFKDE